MAIEGDWRGARCFIVGGGPSLKGFDFSLLANRPHVIAINMAYRDLPNAEIFFTEDLRVIELAHRRADWLAFKGRKIFHALAPEYARDALTMDATLEIVNRTSTSKMWSQRFQDGLSYSSNSMIGALNIADIMGSDPIYILGLDCQSSGGRESNYHDEYERARFERTGDHQYQSFRSDFENWAAIHLRHKIVVNLNRDSAVECWTKVKGTYAEELANLRDAVMW